MGERDISINAWLQDKERFADLFNGLVFNGEKVVKKEELVLLPTHTKTIIEGKQKGKKKRREGLEKYRDVVMLWRGVTLAFMAIENQENINYQMPIRTMLYDALSYREQTKDIWQGLTQEERSLLSKSEYISQFRKNDKLTPVVTLVLYYGDDDWEGPIHLHDMLELPNDSQKAEIIKRVVPDYKMNLVELAKVDNKCFVTDLQIMFGMLKYRKDKVSLLKYIEMNHDYFAEIDEATLDAGMSLLSFSSTLADKLERLWESGRKEDIKNKGGDYNMCKAIEDMMNDSREEGYRVGEIVGTIKTCKDLEVPKEDAIKRIIIKFQLTEDEVTDMFDKHWQ